MAEQNKLKVLFIAWDGPQTSYLEGLFMPIFSEIAKTFNIEFHIIQFTWADPQKTNQTKAVASALHIHYGVQPVKRKPHPLVGSLVTVWQGSSALREYIRQHKIDVVMPRSTFPAIMVNRIANEAIKIIFDADGLPLEERLDFGRLKADSIQYKLLKDQEIKMLKRADAVITRSTESIKFHLSAIGEQYQSKFAVVFNGRNPDVFKFNPAIRLKKRAELEFMPDERVFLYCGSLGAQYGWDEMLSIFSTYAEKHPAKWLILTGDTEYARKRIPNHLNDRIKIMTLQFSQVPDYLNVADVAFAIRQPSFSMKGVAPIKLGEYLLMGLPTIASKGIGDTESILKNMEGCFIYDHEADVAQVGMLMQWLDQLDDAGRQQIREKALAYFSINAAADSYIKVLNKFVS